MANALLIWDNNKSYVGNTLSLELGISYPDDCIFSFEELKQNKFVSAKDVVIVLLDTDLDGKERLKDFYGLEIVKYLRKEVRYKGLIVVYSTLTEQLIRENVKEIEILFTSGIRLKEFRKRDAVNADEISELTQSVPKLSDDLLDDIRYNVFDTKGKIHELLHNLKNKLNDIKEKKTIKDFTKETKTVFEEYRKLLLKEIDPFKITEFEKLYAALIEETVEDITNQWNKEKEKSIFSYANAGNQVNKFTNQIVELAPVSNDDANTQKAENINWQVLLFDDTEGVRKKVKAFFEEKNVTCHTAATEEDVYQILKENSPNISLFISDIRLLDKSEHWCDRQGYDVIEQVNKTNDYPLVYAVLTSKKGTINKMVQKKRKYEILWFTKDDVINNIHSFNIFFDLIKEYADNNFKANSEFKIENETWLSPTVRGAKEEIFYRFALKDYYKVHYESEDHDDAESEINLMTKQILNGTIENSIQWICKLTSKNIDQHELNKFRKNILLGRRLILAYIFSEKKINTEVIYLKAYKKTDYNKNTAKTYLSNICLPNRFDTLLYDKILEYHYPVDNKKKTIPLIQEEYEFIRKEFIDIATSNEYELDETELNLLKKLFNIFFEIFKDESDLDEIPLSIKKATMLLNGKTTVLPSTQLLFEVAEDVKNNIRLFTSENFKISLDQFEDNVLRTFLEKCDLIEK
jgi:CheY-like chemotaxis protein